MKEGFHVGAGKRAGIKWIRHEEGASSARTGLADSYAGQVLRRALEEAIAWHTSVRPGRAKSTQLTLGLPREQRSVPDACHITIEF